jgi:hypothetical protein
VRLARAGLTAVACVTLRPGAAFDEVALRQFRAAGLARFKVPARCVLIAKPRVAQRLLTGSRRHQSGVVAKRLKLAIGGRNAQYSPYPMPMNSASLQGTWGNRQ